LKTLAFLIIFAGLPLLLHAQQPALGTEAEQAAGKELYLEKCAQCHGETGDGQGSAAAFFRPAPRNFTSAIFKFRTTGSGELPSDADIKRSIRNGMPYTGMPAWPQLSETEVTNLMYFLKTISSDFSGPYGMPAIVEIPKPPGASEASLLRGRAVYEENQCADCHGDTGRGYGKSAPTLADQWNTHIRPADLTKRWTFRNGARREDIYRTFTTGLDGSPMPSYDMSQEDRWALVDYVYSLSRDTPDYATVAIAQGVTGALDLSMGRALFETAPAALFPVVGQVIEPGRAFYPGTNAIEVRAVYNQNEIAIQLSWNDMRAETTGHNSPALTVPRVEAAASDSLDSFSDAVAVQWPSQQPAGTERPYLLFGDRKRSVDLWFVDLARGEAEIFVGKGYESIEPVAGDLSVTSNYDEGEWTVIFKHQRTSEEGLSFDEGSFVPLAFSVWDGFNRERGNKRGLTSWYHVYIAPMETASALGPMLLYGLGTLLFGLGLVAFTRRKYRGQDLATV